MSSTMRGAASPPRADGERLPGGARSDRVRLLYSGVPLGVAGGVVLPFALAWVLALFIPARGLVAWCAAQVLAHGAFWVATRLPPRRGAAADARWLARFRGGALLIGLAWAALPLLTMRGSPLVQVLGACVLIAASGVALAKPVPDLTSALLFLAPQALSLSASLALSSDRGMPAIGLLSGVYFLGLALAMRRSSQAFDESVRIQSQNAELAACNAFLGQVHLAMVQAPDEAALLRAVCDHAVADVGVGLAWIGCPDADGRVRLLAWAGPAAGAVDGVEWRVSPGTDSALAEAWARQQPSFGGLASTDPLASRAAAQDLVARAVLPVSRRGRPWGLIALYGSSAECFGDLLQGVLRTLAERVSQGLDVLEAWVWTETFNQHSEAGMALLRERRIVFCNRRLADMFGYDDPDAMVGLETLALYPDAASHAAVGEQYARLAGGEAVHLQSLVLRRRDGSLMPCDLTGLRVDATQSTWTILDVTQREAQHRQMLQLEGLYRALLGEADVLLQARTEASMLEQTCSQLGRETLFHAVWIARPGDDGMFRALASSGAGSALVRDVRVGVDDPLALVARAWREQSPTVDNDNLASRRGDPWEHALERERWCSALAVPVGRGDRPWAVLVLVAAQAGAFDAKTVDACSRVAALLGHALDELDLKQRMALLQSEEAHRARHDPLTGLPNRRALEQHLAQAIARAERSGRAMALGMIDLDDFKPVNDRHGHAAGDRLLRELGTRLQGHLRATDFLARMGGDEFMVVFEQLDPSRAVEDVAAAAVRVHAAVDAPFDLGQGGDARVGMSMGVALYPHDGGDADALMRAADAAMYKSKADKGGRGRWWQLSSEAPEVPAPAPVFDPFGPVAERLLGALSAHLARVAEAFTAAFYAELETQGETAAILACLTGPERERLQAAQTRHLGFLMHPGTSSTAIVARARHLGTVHALTGVSPTWLTRATNLHHDLLQRQVDAMAITAWDRYHTLRAADVRLQLDLYTQLDALQAVVDAGGAHTARPLPPWGGSWASMVQDELDALGQLPGVLACQLMRPRDDGAFALEFNSGPAAEAMEAIAHSAALAPQLDARLPVGQGLIPLAWQSEAIQTSDAYAMDPRTQTWHAPLVALGVRSLVAIPVLGEQGPEFVLVLEGAFPHQFSSRWARDLCVSLQNRWSQIVRLTRPGAVAPLSVSQSTEYRRLFHSGALRMDMQPVIDLRSGRPVKFEALARLGTPEGRIIPPGEFLPALRDSDLDMLFREGLDRSLACLQGWREAGLAVDLSLNLAPSTLVHPDCARWVAEALRRHQVAPRHLVLELLETQEFAQERFDEAIAELQRLGVRLAIDDLGSGYSSLKRLASLQFDVIKVDQSLVRDMTTDPVKTLSLVRTIVQIGRDFDREVVVEGLENAAVIEAVMRLGASQGQGWGLARPMPADAVADWARAWTWDPAPRDALRSALGALALHWRSMHSEPGRELGPAEECPLGAFLRARGLAGSEVEQAHRTVHQRGDAAARAQASRRLIAWLVDRVREEHAAQ